MLTTAIISAIWSFAGPLIDRIPDVEMETAGYLDGFGDYLAFACYMLPMPTVISIVQLTIGLYMLRIVVSFLRTLWGALPIV